MLYQRVRIDVPPIVVIMKITVFCDVTPCFLTNSYQSLLSLSSSSTQYIKTIVAQLLLLQKTLKLSISLKTYQLRTFDIKQE
jgi:hypothetical protein